MSTDNDLILETLRREGIETLGELSKHYPDTSSWELRQALAEVRRERLAERPAALPSLLRELPKRGLEAWEMGFFNPPTLEIPTPILRPPSVPRTGGIRYGILSDIHAGDEHDWSALDVAIQVCQAAGIDELIINGDLFHAGAFSRHDPTREQHVRFIEERKKALPVAGYIRASFPEMRIQMNYGNHDLWPERFILKHAQPLEGLFPLDQILGIDPLGFEISPNGRILLGEGRVLVKHGTSVSQYPGESVKREILKSNMSTVIGHVHRLAYVEHRKAVHEIQGMQPYLGVELGCLCSLRPDYLPDEDSSNWSQGFALMQVAEDGHVSAELVSIHQGRADWRGMTFRSRLAGGSTYRELDASVAAHPERGE